ncbi:FAD-binding protein [Slackia sp.]|uniref:twin-arginine translocation signal domain-containing protein n=1 Tax=Slackia sp. TaxID=2049041 RepID=UPI00399B0131
MEKELSRRNFLKGLGVVGATTAAATALSACSPSTSKPEEGSTDEVSQGSNWKNPPAEVTDFAQEIDCDVVVCGHGFAGLTACRELAEEGKSVYLVEKQPKTPLRPSGTNSPH